MKARMRWLTAAVIALSLVLALTAAGCGGDDEPASEGSQTGAAGETGTEEELGGKLVISNWDAYMPEDLIPNFEKETGVDVELAKHTTNEDIMGKIEAANGGGFDLVFVSGPFAEALTNRGWAAEIDASQIPNLENLAPEANELAYDEGNAHSVPYTWGTTGLCYRSDKLDFDPDSWDVFFNPPSELDGKMTMLATDRWLLLPALKLMGESINATDEATLQEARDMLRQAKENLLAYDDTTFYSKLVSGEALLVEAWDGWCNYGIAENDAIEFVVPKEGSDVWTDTMVVLESAENKAAAHAFIDFVLRPENHASVAELVLYKVPNPEAMEAVDPKLLKQYPNLAMTPQELLTFEPERDLGEAAPLWSRIVSEITSG
jgi:spermidine/putrescine transport system substrate-binding protein